jgi:hypothetical protein
MGLAMSDRRACCRTTRQAWRSARQKTYGLSIADAARHCIGKLAYLGAGQMAYLP